MKGSVMKCVGSGCGAEVDLDGPGKVITLPRGPGSSAGTKFCSNCGRMYWLDGTPVTHPSEGSKNGYFKGEEVVYK